MNKKAEFNLGQFIAGCIAIAAGCLLLGIICFVFFVFLMATI